MAWREQSGRFENEVMTGKEVVLSFRVSTGLAKALEAQAKAWNSTTVSEVARDIIKFYFLPMACEIQAKESGLQLVQLSELQGIGKLGGMMGGMVEYMQFLQLATKSSKVSVEFMERILEKLEKLLEAAKDEVMQELELELKN